MGSNPSPDHMRFTDDHLGAILKRGPAVSRPADLPDTGASLNPLDAQSRIKVLAGDPSDEQLQGREKQSALS